mmetsp:Transcript_9136/g.15877  ORF Transcript_9136/g.15877 Transcript_9136/m.15877 type:complete len:103 (+) Transcript_9136:2113-2421(+)
MYTQANEVDDHDHDVVYEFVDLPYSKLKEMLKERGMSVHGTKSEMVMKLALRQLKSEELSAGQYDLSMLTVPELRELKTSLGLKGTAPNKSALIEMLQECLA